MASIRSLEPGKFIARIRIKGRPEVSKVFRDARKAQAWATVEEQRLRDGSYRDTRKAERMLVRDLIDDYVRTILPRLKSADTTGLRLKRFRRDLGAYSLATLNRAVIAGWRDARLAAGIANDTVRRELGILSSLINYAIKDLGVDIEANPVSFVRMPPASRGRDRRPTDDEQQRIFDALVDHPGDVQGEKRSGAYRVGTRNPWIRPFIELAIETAARRGELLKLLWQDVNIERRTALFRDTKKPRPDHPPQDRTISLTPRAVEILSDLPRTPDARVFPISADAIKGAWKRAAARAGIQNLRVHDLRHEGTSRLFELGLNMMQVASVTGHQDVRSLKRYTHIDPESLAQEIADLTAKKAQARAAAEQNSAPTHPRGQKKKPG